MDNSQPLPNLQSPSIVTKSLNNASSSSSSSSTSSTAFLHQTTKPSSSSTPSSSSSSQQQHGGNSAISAMLSLRADLEAMKQSIVKQTLLRSTSTGSVSSPVPLTNDNNNYFVSRNPPGVNSTMIARTDNESFFSTNGSNDVMGTTVQPGGILLGSTILTSYFDNPESTGTNNNTTTK